MSLTIAFLVGKKPRPETIITETIAVLESRGVPCRVLLPHDGEVGLADLDGVSLIVHRGLSHRADPLLTALAAEGLPLCNPWTGSLNLRDRATTSQALLDAGLPAPSGTVLSTWSEVLEAATGRHVVVKAVHGPGRGRGVIHDPLPHEPPMPGPFLVENWIEHDGIDRKLYIAGHWVRGLLKPSTLTHEHTTSGTSFEVDPELAVLGRNAAAGVGVHLAGVDVVIGPDGPMVVDVNVFPGFRGVDGSAEAVADHLLDHADAAVN